MQTLDPEVLALLAQEFIADAGQGIARMRQQLHATLGGADDELHSNYELLAGLHHEVHKIKGTAGLCGFPSLTNMAGHFEAYLTAADGLADAKQLQQFINILGLLLTLEDARGAIIGQAALDCLPTSPGHPADSVIGSHEAVAVIASHDADFSARMCQYLGNMGVAAVMGWRDWERLGVGQHGTTRVLCPRRAHRHLFMLPHPFQPAHPLAALLTDWSKKK